MKITGNKKLKNKEVGVLKIERKLALRMAEKAFNWLYCCMHMIH